MKVYSPSDIRGLLNISDSTLRKYSILLENVGYEFQRNSQNQRWYSDEDVIVFRKLITLKNNGGMTLKECAESVYLWARGDTMTDPKHDTQDATERHEIAELKQMIQEQSKLIHELSSELKNQRKLIDENLGKKDELIEHEEPEEVEPTRQTRRKKSLFERLFKR